MTNFLCSGSQQIQSLSPYSVDELMCVVPQDAEVVDDQNHQIDSYVEAPQMEVSEAGAAPFAALAALALARSGFAELMPYIENQFRSADWSSLKYSEEQLLRLKGSIDVFLAQGRDVPQAVRDALNSRWPAALDAQVQSMLTVVRSGGQVSRDQLQALSSRYADAVRLLQAAKSTFQTARPESLFVTIQEIEASLSAQIPSISRSMIVDLSGRQVDLSAARAAIQAARAATPVFEAFAAEAGVGVSEVRIVIDAVDDVVPAAQTRTVVAEAGPMVRAQAAPVVQSLRSAGFSGGPYTRPLLLVAGAAVLIGAGWYWLSEE